MFAQIQQAYEVLSDAHERAWYDRHREQILRGGFDDDNYTDQATNLFAYFTVACYKGYGDGADAFYAVYRTLFATLAAEDEPYMVDHADAANVPPFGDAHSDYDSVVAVFYAHWAAYSTLKPYTWLDKYDIRQAPNRWTSRAMEKEMRKERDAARRARNEEVQELVGFVRRRDPRVKAHRERLEVIRVEAQRKQAENRKKQIQERLK